MVLRSLASKNKERFPLVRVILLSSICLSRIAQCLMYSVKAESSGKFSCILQVYIPNSIKVALANLSLAIGLWAFQWAQEHGAMLCLSDRQTIDSQCATANAHSNLY